MSWNLWENNYSLLQYLLYENSLVLVNTLKIVKSVYLYELGVGRKQERNFLLWKLLIPFFLGLAHGFSTCLCFVSVSWLFVLIVDWDYTCHQIIGHLIRNSNGTSRCKPFFRLHNFLANVCIWKIDWFSTSCDLAQYEGYRVRVRIRKCDLQCDPNISLECHKYHFH